VRVCQECTTVFMVPNSIGDACPNCGSELSIDQYEEMTMPKIGANGPSVENSDPAVHPETLGQAVANPHEDFVSRPAADQRRTQDGEQPPARDRGDDTDRDSADRRDSNPTGAARAAQGTVRGGASVADTGATNSKGRTTSKN